VLPAKEIAEHPFKISSVIKTPLRIDGPNVFSAARELIIQAAGSPSGASQRIDRSDAGSTALGDFGVEVQLDIGEDGLNRVLECGGIVPFSLRQIAPGD
jgi:hypothetical protein